MCGRSGRDRLTVPPAGTAETECAGLLVPHLPRDDPVGSHDHAAGRIVLRLGRGPLRPGPLGDVVCEEIGDVTGPHLRVSGEVALKHDDLGRQHSPAMEERPDKRDELPIRTALRETTASIGGSVTGFIARGDLDEHVLKQDAVLEFPNAFLHDLGFWASLEVAAIRQIDQERVFLGLRERFRNPRRTDRVPLNHS